MSEVASTAKPQMRTLSTSGGEYIMLDQIGKGGMGQVWSANLVKGEIYNACAIKILHGALALTEDARERFLNEARIACQLDHPRIVRVTDMGMLGDAPFLVMDRVDGVDLRKLQEAVGEPLAIELALYIVGEVLSALEYAHERTIGGSDAGVVHSDVTPGNILISSSGEVKLTDFGIARFAHVDGTRTRPIGTPRYMSAEQRRGRTPRATDIFSLGVILHELVEGARYLEGYDDQRFTYAILNGEIPPLTRPGVPEWIDLLRRQMLADDTRDRPRAGDARAMILQKTPHYMLAAKRLEETYRKLFGSKRSGMTKLLNSKELFRAPQATPVKLELESLFAAVSAPPEERTVAEGNSAQTEADADAPAQFRRARSLGESARTPSIEAPPPMITRTGTDSPLLHAQRLAAAGAAQPEPAPERGRPTPPPMLALESEPSALGPGGHEEIEPTIVLDPPPDADSGPVLEPGPVAQPEPVFERADATEEESEPSADAEESESTAEAPSLDDPASTLASRARQTPEARRPSPALWGVFGGLGALIVGLSIWIGVLLGSRPEPAPRAEVAPASIEVAAEPEPEPEPAPAEQPANQPEPPAAIEPAPRAEALPEPMVEAVPTPPPVAEEPEPEPEPEPVAAPKPKPEPKQKPKQKPKPTVTKVDVVFLIPGQAEIEIGRTKLTGKVVASTRLPPGSYNVRWRKLPDGEWIDLGKTTLSELPPDKGYQIRVTGTNMSVSTTRKGSAK